MSIETMQPGTVSDAKLAFPGNVDELLPAWDMIPEEFKEDGFVEPETGSGSYWAKFANHWFSLGLAGGTDFYCREGIDGETAVRHLRAILRSYQPKHEHKLAGVAYLCSLWFEKVENYEHMERGSSERSTDDGR